MHQGTQPELGGHFDALFKENKLPTEFNAKLQKDIQTIKLEEEANKSEINIILWNCDSLGATPKEVS